MKATVLATLALLAGAAAVVKGAPAAPEVAVTARDVQAAREEIALADRYFAKTWSGLLLRSGYKFAPPKVSTYELTKDSEFKQTGCGKLEKDNAFFCDTDNAIYLDEIFLSKMMKQAAAAFKTDGDYTAIAILAHEYGHAVDVHVSGARGGYEDAADCLAGAITRQAELDRLLEKWDLAEGFFSLRSLGDDRLQGQRYNRFRSSIVGHGAADERGVRFMRGYYGGPSLCLIALGPAKPPQAGHVIAEKWLKTLLTVPNGKSSNCTWSNEAGGLRVRNTGSDGACMLNLVPGAAMVPSHLRIELTVTKTANGIHQNDSGAGLFYGDGHFAPQLTFFGLEIDSLGGLNLARAGDKSNIVDVYSQSGVKRISEHSENRLMLDIHHSGNTVYFVEYANGFAVDFGHWQGAAPRKADAAAHAGAWLREPGDEAIFRDFRVSALPD
jgi:predicted metalloprotease